MKLLYKLISIFLKIFDLKLVRASSDINYIVPKRLTYISIEEYFNDFCNYSRSKYGQEWLVFKLLGEKKNDGYFVEIGAADGIHSSNTYFLENVLNWRGILVEPAKKWHEKLRINRKNIVESDCIHSESNENLIFCETLETGGSYISDHHEINKHKKIQNEYSIKAITLNDLFAKHSSPKRINFLSLDTEGNEYEILKNYDFADRIFDILCIETNYDEDKKNLLTNLLNKNNYHLLNLPENITKNDTWFINKDVEIDLNIKSILS